MGGESMDADSTLPIEGAQRKRAKICIVKGDKYRQSSCVSAKSELALDHIEDNLNRSDSEVSSKENQDNNDDHEEHDNDHVHDHRCHDDEHGGVETLEIEYWDDLYGTNVEEGVTSEYLLSYITLRPFILKFTGMDMQMDSNTSKSANENLTMVSVTSSAINTNPKSGRVLIPGCGDTTFSEQLHKDGYSPIYNTDTSSGVIEIMKQRCKDQRGLKWFVDDALCSQFEDSFFDKIIDKSLIDCFYWVKDEGVHVDNLISNVLSEYNRILTDDGVIMITTIRTPQEFLPFIDQSVPHSVEAFSRRLEEGITDAPCQWEYKYVEICTEANEENLVPKDITAYEVTDGFDPTKEFENYAVFFIYVLRKKRQQLFSGINTTKGKSTSYNAVNTAT